jgi:tetratricopeptide (TPR) repeat protein
MKKNNNVWIAVAVVIGIAVVLFLSDRPVTGKGDSQIIRNSADFEKFNKEASELALDVFRKADGDEEINDADRDKLRKAVTIFESMRAYSPLQVSSQFGAGKCYMLLGELQKATECFEQAFYNRQVDPQKDDQMVKLTVIECQCLLAECLVEMAATTQTDAASAEQAGNSKDGVELRKRANIYQVNAYTHADAAVKAQPEGIRYLVTRANAALALGRKSEARADAEKAYKLAPANPRVKMIARLFGLIK